MKHAHSFQVAGVLCVILLSTHGIAAQDWPQWRGPNRDARVSGFSVPKEWPQTLTAKWKTTVGTGDATPALVGDKLYVFTRQGEEEVTLCLDAATGLEKWKDQYAAQAVTGAAARHPGPRSSLAVAEGKVVTLGVGGVLSCLDAATGKMVWRKDPFPKVTPRFFTSMSPMIVDGMVIVHLGGEGKGAVIAYALADGQQKWEWTEEGPAYASPVLMTANDVKQIVTLTEKSIVGIGLADGKLLWQLPFVPQGRAYNAATPIVDGQTVIYTGAGRGTFSIKIEKEGDAFAAKELWSNPDIATQYNTPVLRDGLLFGLSNSGTLFCLDAATGKTAWVDAAQLDRSGFGAIVNAGAVLMALPSSAEMIVFEPAAAAYKEVARIKVSETPIYSYPVIAGNNLYIKDQDTVALYTIE